MDTILSPAVDDRQELKKTSVFMMAFLATISSGIYLPVWFLTRRQAINALASNDKLDATPSVLALAGLAFGVVVGTYSSIETVMGVLRSGTLTTAAGGLDLCANLVSLLACIPLVTESLKVRKILDDHFNGHLHCGAPLSKLYTLLFLNFYLQHRINRLHRQP